MNWIPIIIVLALLVWAFFIKKRSEIPIEAAVQLFKKGALLLDVRTAAEFSSGHVAGSVNVPLGEIDTVMPNRVKDKNQVLLLYCASGVRSTAARKRLNSLGYTNAFNLGSFGRAKEILNGGE